MPLNVSGQFCLRVCFSERLAFAVREKSAVKIERLKKVVEGSNEREGGGGGTSQNKVRFPQLRTLTVVQITNTGASDWTGPNVIIRRQKQGEKIQLYPKMSLRHPNLAALGVLPTHIVWPAMPPLPWGCVDLHRP